MQLYRETTEQYSEEQASRYKHLLEVYDQNLMLIESRGNGRNMAIYLNEKAKEQDVVIRALKKDKTIMSWVRKSLIERLEYDRQNAERRKACDHEQMTEFVGERLSCDECGGYGDGGFFKWTRKEYSKKP